jgi:hypothetical protein
MLIYFMAIWNILKTFRRIFYNHLVYICSFCAFFRFLVSCTKKNLATLIQTREEDDFPRNEKFDAGWGKFNNTCTYIGTNVFIAFSFKFCHINFSGDCNRGIGIWSLFILTFTEISKFLLQRWVFLLGYKLAFRGKSKPQRTNFCLKKLSSLRGQRSSQGVKAQI